MTKAELIDEVAVQAELSKKDAGRAVDALVARLTIALMNGKEAVLPGMGKFLLKDRPARPGRNPRTGETIELKAIKRVVFRPAKALKDAVS